jgi:hypothetical protein
VNRTERRVVDKCPICESTDLVEVGTLRDEDTTEAFHASRCTVCWTTSLTDPPVDSELGLYYELHGHMQSPGSLFASVRRLKIRREVQAVASRLPEGGKVLDYGTGDGSMGASLHDLGFRVTASDTIPESQWDYRDIPYVQSVPGQPLAQLLEARGPFDAVVFRHVIEHLPDPVTTLREFADHDTGIVYLVVPNALSPGARLAGEKWFYWDPPRHLYGFAPQSIQVLAARTGFRVEELTMGGLDWIVTSAHRAIALRSRGSENARGLARTALSLTRPSGLLAAGSSAMTAPFGSTVIFAVLRRN